MMSHLSQIFQRLNEHQSNAFMLARNPHQQISKTVTSKIKSKIQDII